jgi:hypothetical protein
MSVLRQQVKRIDMVQYTPHHGVMHLLYWLVPELRGLEHQRREMAKRHAWERAELDAWIGECERYLIHGPDTVYLPPFESESELV